MSRPQGVQTGSAGNTVDATICAHSGNTIERRYTVADLQRLREAGAQEGTAFDAVFRFSRLERRIAVDGELTGVMTLTCQRCLKPFGWKLSEQFQVTLVRSEAELDQEPGGYEAIVADPAHLDLRTLAEDQALLALPLVPKHASETCSDDRAAAEPAANEPVTSEPATSEAETTQRPFGNLRDLMRGH